MDDYIDRNIAIHAVDMYLLDAGIDREHIAHTITILKNLPAEDVRGNRRGNWLDPRGIAKICDCCGSPAPFEYSDILVGLIQTDTPFCPHCGADMRGKTNDEKDH